MGLIGKQSLDIAKKYWDALAFNSIKDRKAPSIFAANFPNAIKLIHYTNTLFKSWRRRASFHDIYLIYV